jgi:hypothetical protein
VLIRVKTFSVEKTPSTKRPHAHETPSPVQPEPKRPRSEVNRLSSGKNRPLHITKSKRSIKHASKNYYRWNPEHLITFPWLRYNDEEGVASCRLKACKMYNPQFLVSNVVEGGSILASKPGCLASMRILSFTKCSVI